MVYASRREFSRSKRKNKGPLHHSFYSNVSHFDFISPPTRIVTSGDIATHFIEDIGLELQANTCPNRPQAIEKGENFNTRYYCCCRICFFPLFVSERGDSRTCLLQETYRNSPRSDLPMLNMKWNITQKLHPTLKSSLSNTCKIRMLSASQLNAHAVSKGCTLKFCPQQPLGLTSEKGFSFFFSLNTFGRTYSTYVRTYARMSKFMS